MYYYFHKLLITYHNYELMAVKNLKKSWSGLRKKLENDLLCDCLKGRIQYFYTCYHSAPDQYGRIAIRVDGKEIIKGNPFDLYIHYNSLERKNKRELNTPTRYWGTDCEFINNAENQVIEEGLETLAIWEGVFEVHHIYGAIIEYTNQSIEKSFNSGNPIVKMLSLLDRRIGKRRLLAVAREMDNQPEWVRYFYNLRVEAECLEEQVKKSTSYNSAFTDIVLRHRRLRCGVQLLRQLLCGAGEKRRELAVR
jgi:hypothetical protein